MRARARWRPVPLDAAPEPEADAAQEALSELVSEEEDDEDEEDHDDQEDQEEVFVNHGSAPVPEFEAPSQDEDEDEDDRRISRSKSEAAEAHLDRLPPRSGNRRRRSGAGK